MRDVHYHQRSTMEQLVIGRPTDEDIDEFLGKVPSHARGDAEFS